VGHPGLLAETGADEWSRVMDSNARGPWLCRPALAPTVQEAGRPGSMVAVSSISAHVVDRIMGVYCATRAALNMMVEVATAEWGPSGIRVNALAPGVTMTPVLGRAEAGSPWLRRVAERAALRRRGECDDIGQAVIARPEMDRVSGQGRDCVGGPSRHRPIDPYGEIEQARRSPR
jgi:NAD(P)-dependent dehydrogenase (short-subunit alcohol dehydrogenase family)